MTSTFQAFQNGRYQVLRVLGEGGKGIVFLCQDAVLGRRVAVKVIKALDAFVVMPNHAPALSSSLT